MVERLSVYEPCAVGLLVDIDTHDVVGQVVLNHFRPLYQAEAAAANVVLKPYVEHLLGTAYAVEVEVVDRVLLTVEVFVDYSKSG